MHYKWTLHSRTSKQVKHLRFAKLRIVYEFFWTEKKFVKFVIFYEWKKFVKFEFSIYGSKWVQVSDIAKTLRRLLLTNSFISLSVHRLSNELELNTRGVAEYSDFGLIGRYISETVQWGKLLWVWYQSKDHMRLPISDRWNYAAVRLLDIRRSRSFKVTDFGSPYTNRKLVRLPISD